MPFDAINTSDHTLIKVEITTQISKLAPKSAKIYTRNVRFFFIISFLSLSALPFEFPLSFQIQCAFLASLDAWSMLRFHIPLPTDSKKDKLISEIMEASQDDSKTFHKLLRMQRSNSAINTDTLVIDNVE
jgi:hypothetical protein